MTIAAIRQLGGLGDAMMVTPVFRGLREKHPDATLRCVTSSAYMRGALTAIFSHCPFVDEVVDVDPARFTTRRTIENQPSSGDAALIDDHPCVSDADLAIDLNNACWDGECTEIDAFGKVVTPRTELWCRQAGVDPSDKRPCYVSTPEERAFATQTMRAFGWLSDERPIAIVCLSSAAENRSLPQETVSAIMDGLWDAGMRPIAAGLSYGLDLRHEQIPLGPLATLFPLMELADVFVGVDSGLLHVAGAAGLPIVGLFGSTDPAVRLNHYPRSVAVEIDLPCRPCWYRLPCRDASFGVPKYACMSGISTESVVAAARGILEA